MGKREAFLSHLSHRREAGPIGLFTEVDPCSSMSQGLDETLLEVPLQTFSLLNESFEMRKIAAIALVLAVSLTAVAQERKFLSKAEVESLATGKKWTYTRSDGNKIAWDLRSGGNVFGNNRTSGRNDSGTWSVNDQGQLCFKWRGNSGDACFAMYKEGDKLKRVNATDLNGAGNEVEVE